MILLCGGIGTAWTYSHIDPDSFGVCREVPLTIGANPTVRDCQAYGVTDFAVPLIVMGVLVVVVVDEDFKLAVPGFSVEKTRSGKEAAGVLLAQEPTRDARAEEYLAATASDVLKESDLTGKGSEYLESLPHSRRKRFRSS